MIYPKANDAPAARQYIYLLAPVFDDACENVLRFEPVQVTELRVRICCDRLSGDKTLTLVPRTPFGRIKDGSCIRFPDGSVWLDDQEFPDEAAALEYINDFCLVGEQALEPAAAAPKPTPKPTPKPKPKPKPKPRVNRPGFRGGPVV